MGGAFSWLLDVTGQGLRGVRPLNVMGTETEATKATIYWANALFSDADRRYNTDCAKALRSAGYDAILPQDATVNKTGTPSAVDIFRADTSAMLRSQLVVACLDQEAIDSGVACEIGLAYAYGLPVIGLCTDFRQFRTGPGKIYKNLFVVGAINSVAEVVPSVEALLKVLPKYIRNQGRNEVETIPETDIIQHYERVAPGYAPFVSRLESWYKPPWNSREFVTKWAASVLPGKVLEIGCGSRGLGAALVSRYPSTRYLGFDISARMLLEGGPTPDASLCSFTKDRTAVERQAAASPFDLVMLMFTLHEYHAKDSLLTLAWQSLRPGGRLLVVDLSSMDLPLLTSTLKREFASPATTLELRLNPGDLALQAGAVGLELIECNVALPRMEFPTASDLMDYVRMFGISAGMDLPLGLRSSNRESNEARIKDIVTANLAFPFCDQRAFMIAVLQK